MRRYLGCGLVALISIAITFSSRLAANNVAEEQNASRPSLADLMLLTQLRHFKLWYAHSLDNWKLAAYELAQFEATISRIVKLSQQNPSRKRI
jgi:hypothetical protein